MRKNKIPKIKKDLSLFLSSEEAKINRKSALRFSLSCLLAIYAFRAEEAFGHQDHSQSTDLLSNPSGRGEHNAGPVHTSHGVHANHVSDGWC